MTSPNILLIMTDEERYPPPYETDAVKKFRKDQLGARASIGDGALEFHRHYAGSTACVASRATLFTGQYPSLHGVSQTDGTSKKVDDPAMMWLDPDSVPTWRLVPGRGVQDALPGQVARLERCPPHPRQP